MVPREPDGIVPRCRAVAPHVATRILRARLRAPDRCRASVRRAEPRSSPVATGGVRTVAPPVCRSRCGRIANLARRNSGSGMTSQAIGNHPVPIGIVLRSFEPGGTEHQTIELIRRLDPARWQVHVACFYDIGAWKHRLADAAASITEIPVRTLLRPVAATHFRTLVNWCRERRLSVLQTTGLPTNLFALPAAAVARVPLRVGARREINA